MTDDAPVRSPTRMNALEAMMWRAEVDPRLRSPVMVVDLLDVEPDWDRLAADHERATRYVPRLRDRVLEPWWGWGVPEWSPDPGFTLAAHLRRVRLDEPGGLRELLDLAAEWSTTPFDRERPPWEAMLVTGLEGGRAGYLLKVHHSLADGLGLVQVLTLLHGTAREPAGARPVRPVPDPTGRSRLEATAARAVRLPGELLAGVGWAAGSVGGMVAHPLTAARDGAAFVASAARAAVPHHVPPSPLLRHRSLDRRFLTWDVDLETLKQAGRAAGGSLNDAYLAAVLGGVARYHARFGVVPERVSMGMPMNTRGIADALGGNHWAGLRFAAPLREPDPAVRVRLVRGIVADLRRERVMDGLGLIAPVLAALPPVLLAGVQGGATRRNDVQASNVPGLARPAFVAGAEIERSYAFGPLPGGAVMVALLSHRSTCCVAATVDPAAITDPDLFSTCLSEAFDEVLALA